VKDTLHKLLVVCCALYLSGAHWVALQTTAWTGMLISRTISTSVSEAVESTFDGQHPCRVCKAISSGKQTEERSQHEFELLKKAGELKFLDVRPLTVFHPRSPVGSVRWSAAIDCLGRGPDAPPTPPPLG
jgi:hypothetical protein